MSTIEQAVEVDGDKLMQFVFRAVDEVGATLNTALVVMGDRLGLYRALAGARRRSRRPNWPSAPATAERYVREWLERPGRRRLRRPTTRTAAATRCRPSRPSRSPIPSSPAYLPGFFQIALGSVIDSPKIVEAARSGDGRRLARARPRRPRGVRAVLPARATTRT